MIFGSGSGLLDLELYEAVCQTLDAVSRLPMSNNRSPFIRK